MPSDALQRAYASNQDSVIVGVEFSHSAFPSGVLRYTIGREPATLGAQLYIPASMAIQRPARSTEGSQQLTITLSNADNVAYKLMESVIKANRSNREKVNVIFREFLSASPSVVVSEIQGMHVSGASADKNTVSLACIYTPLPSNKYPPLKYYANKYPALKHASR